MYSQSDHNSRPLPSFLAIPSGGRQALRAAFALVLSLAIAGSAVAQETLTVETAVQRALARNFTIQVESFSVPIAETSVREAKGRFDPRLFIGYSDGTNEQPQRRQSDSGAPLPASVFKSHGHQAGIGGELPLGLSYEIGGSIRNDRDNINTNFDDLFSSSFQASARLPLLRGFGPAATLTSLRIARTNRDISEWDFRSTVINTITGVIYAYNDVLFAYANLRSARRSRELANGLFTENERRNQVGSMSDYDVLSARARVATREEGILIAERYVRESENRFKQLISDDTSADLLRYSFLLAAPPPPDEVIVDVVADLPTAMESRPDYRQAQLALARNEFSYKFYRNQLLPAVDLEGSYGYSGVNRRFNESVDQVRDRDYPSYRGGISISIPLTSTAERARYHASKLVRAQSEMALRQLEQTIVINIGNAAGQIETTWKRLLATRASRDLSQQALDAEVKKLRAGTGSTFIVLQLQEILSNDEVREARAVSDYRNALAEYDRQVGRTLETFRIDLAEAGEPGGSK